MIGESEVVTTARTLKRWTINVRPAGTHPHQAPVPSLVRTIFFKKWKNVFSFSGAF